MHKGFKSAGGSRNTGRRGVYAPLVRKMVWDASQGMETLLDHEWLVANGLGGYASSSVSGACTRKYHGLLVAAMPSPLGRVVMLSGLREEVRLPDGSVAELGCEEESSLSLKGAETQFLREFRLEAGLPVWRYEVRDYVIEKRILLPHRQNTVHINYNLVSGGGPVKLRLRPYMHFRKLEEEVRDDLRSPYMIRALGNRYEVISEEDFPILRFFLYARDGSFNLSGGEFKDVLYRVEERRCYACRGNMWSPGYYRMNLIAGSGATMIASTENWDVVDALTPDEAFRTEAERRQRLLAAAHPLAQTGPAAELALAADQFIMAPITRVADAARAYAAGGEVRSIIAGYHWFTDWGRDTMISLEGLTLATGRFQEASYILRTFAHYIKDGLIPNLFPEGKAEGLYHTADATLWFFHAIDRYLQVTGDLTTLDQLLPRLVDIVSHHIRGVRFGIGVDSRDGLLRQGASGYQLTWMDAKVGDWVVTPRRGKAVEINALWYNALRLLEGWLRSERGEADAREMSEAADRVYESFNKRFWFEEGGYLYDVIDGEQGDDKALRPNQLFAISLRHPVLDPSKWSGVVDIVKTRLLTPFGLRTLAAGHPDYKLRYYGDLCSRDAAYHQGTVWPWLIGPFVDAWIKVYPEDAMGARRFLEGLLSNLDEVCIGMINEVFDAEAPFNPEGCVAQAWSVAEMLRAWIRTGEAFETEKSTQSA